MCNGPLHNLSFSWNMFHFVVDDKVTSVFWKTNWEHVLYLGEYGRYQCFRRTCCLHLQLLPSVYDMLTFDSCLHFGCKSYFVCEMLVHKN